MDKLNVSSSKNTKPKQLVFSFLVLSIGLIAILSQFESVNCSLPFNEVDTNNRQALLDALRSFGIYQHDINNYQDLDYKEVPKYHQMERKGGRAPSLRLRFGRRSDPSWSPLFGRSNSQENVN